MKLIVGLGNPGKEYERTRHNAGWLILDALAEGEAWKTSEKARAEYLKMELNGKRIELLKPLTFMNSSGISVAHVMKNHELTADDIIVIHDDKDIPLGETRVQRDRGAAGHNGVLSIVEHIGTKDFMRIRVGVAPAEGEIHNTADFVLNRFTKEELNIMKKVTENVIEEVKRLV